MSVVHLIDTVTDWARLNICERITLKVPPDNMDPNDGDYAYKLATPAAFPLYVPSAEKAAPNIHFTTPSLCVRFMEGQDVQASGKGFVDLQLVFSTWDPGYHSKDEFQPNGDGTFQRGATSPTHFQRSVDGWRDAWNFVDIALRAVENTVIIGNGYTIDKVTPVKFGPLVEQDIITDYYPFWFAWISFRVNYDLRRNVAEINHLL